jgi:hypothetical protein
MEIIGVKSEVRKVVRVEPTINALLAQSRCIAVDNNDVGSG